MSTRMAGSLGVSREKKARALALPCGDDARIQRPADPRIRSRIGMLTRAQMEDALIKLDRRLIRIEQILQPIPSELHDLKADVRGLKRDLAMFGGEISGLQRDV